jgi:2-C-methyl-D-erythritol 4-phosphate cytidylyltransferase
MTTAIIVAAGRGTRMGPGVDKLFLELAGAPVIAHTWRVWDALPFIDDLVLVVRSGMEEAFRELAVEHGFRKPVQFARGGEERQDSVLSGLATVAADAAIVAIHDGARPCVDAALVRDCIAAAAESGAAVAAQRPVDTIKESADGLTISRHLDRSKLWAVQTPQCFRAPVIRAALGAARAAGVRYSDDTAACEAIGQAVRLVESKLPNPKVTSRADLPWIEHLLRMSAG